MIAYCPYRSGFGGGKPQPERIEVEQALAKAISAELAQGHYVCGAYEEMRRMARWSRKFDESEIVFSISHLDNHSAVVYKLRGDDEVHVVGRSDGIFRVGHMEDLHISDWFPTVVFDETYTEQLQARVFNREDR